MLTRLLISAALVSMPAFASAATLTQLANGAASIAVVDKSTSSDLTGVGSWDLAPLLVTDDDFRKRGYISPFGRGDSVTDFWAIGRKHDSTQHKTKKIFDDTANSESPATLTLTALATSISFLWGSPDGDNSVSLLRDGKVVVTYGGSDVGGGSSGAVFTTITADDESEYFDALRFGASNQTFEFSNIAAVSAVPLPAGVPLILTALGGFAYLARRKKNAQSA